LAMHLAQAGHQVILGSRRPATAPAWLLQSEVIQVIWDESSALEHICTGVDILIQAAGMNAKDCQHDPVAALALNGVATARLVAAASAVGVKRFIYLSTIHVYSSSLRGTITEEDCPYNLHPYATSHLAGEHAVLSASQAGKIEGIVLRLSNAFGEPVDRHVNCWMLLVNDLCKQAVQTGKLVLKTGGLQQRDFISLSEVCRVVEYFSAGFSNSRQTGIFNIGSGVSLSVLTMAQLIQERCADVLGVEPLLERSQGGIDEVNPVLKYRTDKLKSLGVNIGDADNMTEIDSLLNFCHKTYAGR